MIKTKFLIIILIIFHNLAFSQNIIIEGTVFRQNTMQPISYCNISILNSARGTTSNSDGVFKLSLNKRINKIKFSSIGFEDTIITVENSVNNVRVFLSEKSYILDEVIVSPYTWAEQFILEAVKNNEKQKSLIKYYNALSYSKTSFNTKKSGIIALIEAISEVSYLSPNKYKEKVISYKLEPHIKNLPYEFIAINQSINLLNDRSDFLQFSLINPLIKNTLDYYNFSLIKKLVSKNDTLVYIAIEPKQNDKPLYKGELIFSSKNKNLIEANLFGNGAAKTGVSDSLKVFEKFSNNFQNFNMPTFIKYSLNRNYPGLVFNQTQQFTFQNYDINSENNSPYISSKSVLEKNINKDYDLNFGRNEIFNVPLTKSEVAHQQKMKKNFEQGSIFKKFILFTFVDLIPLTFDQPVDLFGMKITNFSNYYRFNKIDGNYIGFEKYLINYEDYLIYSNTGYGFSSEQFYFNIFSKYRNVDLTIRKELQYLGDFNVAKTFQSLNALFLHEDNYNYYNSFQINSNLTLPISQYFDINFSANLEKQKSAKNKTEFSFFYRNLDYNKNVEIKNYWNNYFSVLLDFKTNYNYVQNETIISKGKSFTNISAEYSLWNKKLNSTENLSSMEVKLKSYYEFFKSISLELNTNYYKIKISDYIQKYRFTSNFYSLNEEENPLTFASIGNYHFTLNNYLYLDSYLNLFDLPEILNLRTSLGAFLTAVKSFETPKLVVNKELGKKVFYEYGIGIKGISFFNFYLGMNNLDNKKVFIKVGFGL